MIFNVILLSVIVFQQVYWSIQVQKLIDKLMSRNFYDFKFSDTLKPREDIKKTEVQQEFIEDTTGALSDIY